MTFSNFQISGPECSKKLKVRYTGNGTKFSKILKTVHFTLNVKITKTIEHEIP